MNRDRVVQRILISELLLDLYNRAKRDRQWVFSRVALAHRRDILRAMRAKRGYES